MTHPLLDHIAREIATEAHCFGLSKISYEDSASERKDAWRAIAVAGLLAIRDEVGPTVIDRIIAPEREPLS